MGKKFWPHLGFLFLATLFTFLWVENPRLSVYTAQVIALLIIVYFGRRGVISKRVSFSKNSFQKISSLDGLVLTMVVLLLVFSSGGASSPLFFLLYFLLFGLSFIWESRLTLFFSLFLTIFLFLFAKNINQPTSFLNPISLLFISPLSLFFGRQFLNNLIAQKRIKVYQQKWSEDEKHLENQETKILFWLSTKFKPGMIEILDKISQLLGDISHLTEEQKKFLKRVRRLSHQLLKSGEKLKRSVDLETD